MVEIRISATKDELEQIKGILKAVSDIEIISISGDYPNRRGFDTRVRSYIKLNIREKKPSDYLSDSSFSNFENIGNDAEEVMEYMKEVRDNEPEVLDEMFFSTFCVNCKYLKQENSNEAFFCSNAWKGINTICHSKNDCPIYNNLIKGERKKCM